MDNANKYGTELQADPSDNVRIKFFSVEADAFVESCLLAIVEVYCHIHQQGVEEL